MKTIAVIIGIFDIIMFLVTEDVKWGVWAIIMGQVIANN